MLRRLWQSLRQVLFLMARRPDLVCGAVLLSVLLILAVKFTCSRAKNVVAAARPPVRFFSAEAPVVDLYLGQLDQVERLRSVAEVSLIFFYAPWCAHSMAARHEVQTVAKKLAKQVQFVAVNCWWSQGKCRKQNRLFQYPVIHLFYKRFGPIDYRGPFIAAYVESFVLRVLTPLTYLPSRATLKDFLSYHEPGVVGFFQFNSSPQPPGYLTYLSSALQALKRDFRGGTRFGVVTNRQVAEAISIQEDQTVYLHRRFNSSLIFPRREQNFTSEGICSWVFQHQERVLRWLQPPGTKSTLLEQELTKGPALLLFMPHNPLSAEPHPHLKQVADIALRYHSCDRSERRRWPDAGVSAGCQSVVVQPGSSRADGSTTVCELCLNTSRPGARTSAATPCSCLSRARGGGGALLLLHRSDGVAAAVPAVAAGTSPTTCSNFRCGYDPFSLYSACCRRRQLEPHGAPLPPATDASSEDHGADFVPPPSSPSSSSSSSSSSSIPPSFGEAVNITGLRCRTNKTLNFYVLDVALTWPLAARLGAPGNASGSRPEAALGQGGGRDWSFATIVDLKDEVHYVLDHSPAHSLAEALEAFIRNFSAPYSPLQRHLVGETGPGGTGPTAGSGRPSQEKPQKRPLIVELTTASFGPSIMEADKDVLVFYYTQWCGFCTALNHVLIQLARLFQGNGTMTIARVNVARNDLSWEFMVDHVPAILLFPRHRKHQSVKFPSDELITLPNLLRFLLKHTGPAHRPGGLSGKSPTTEGAPGPGPGPAPGPSVLHAELHLLQDELRALHLARKRLALQLARLWQDHQPLVLEARGVELHRERLKEQHRQKSRQLGTAVRRLQELADAWEGHLGHDGPLLRALLEALRERAEREEEQEVEEEEEERGETGGAEKEGVHDQ
ncbi:thioredoxin domain-containing protein 11 [Gadus chalcogrammus]|uniref:thioredoxin domain-containing protein 11 n=1 Tax=Gadus chalcogrammus TaxID=1042646 RepID=UPI0024C314B7|nr:thioredoxin domain-containing protein 11 [Gadus chalcogrammus]